MAFSFAIDAPAGKHKGSTSIGPGSNWQLVTGTWIGGAGATGNIVTGLSTVIAGDAINEEAVSEACTTMLNDDGSGAGTTAGSIGITAQADATNNVGRWWAIGY